jgi:Collagen triple helix repeat (20 copies)
MSRLASLFAQAQELGFTGTQDQWFANLVATGGMIGPPGTPGLPGAPGEPGLKGDTGDAGPQGPAGPAGAPGLDGNDGADGAPGTPGATGPKGDTGDTGPAGANGTNGTNGIDGIDGAPGVTGPQGPQGEPGTNGTNGAQGPQGNPGISGAQGPQGGRGTRGVIIKTPGVNLYVSAAINALALTTLAGAANRLDYIPFIPDRDITINQLQASVTTLIASSLFRLGLYDSDSNGLPANRLETSGDLSGATVATVSYDLPASRTLLAGNLYWLAIHHSSTATHRAIAVGALSELFQLSGGTSGPTILRQTVTFASGLPATATATHTAAVNSAATLIRTRLA